MAGGGRGGYKLTCITEVDRFRGDHPRDSLRFSLVAYPNWCVAPTASTAVRLGRSVGRVNGRLIGRSLRDP
jgi:hypothetical protein